MRRERGRLQRVGEIARNAPGRLYMQNHCGWGEWEGVGGPLPGIGVLRSDDYGHLFDSLPPIHCVKAAVV